MLLQGDRYCVFLYLITFLVTYLIDSDYNILEKSSLNAYLNKFEHLNFTTFVSPSKEAQLSQDKS